MDELKRILEKYEFRKNPIYNSGLIHQIEQSIGFTLPRDYLFYLQNFSKFEDFIGNGYVVLWDVDGIIENNNGYCIAEWLPSFLGIGSDGGGELLVIEYLDNHTYRIMLVPFVGMEKDVAIEIGSSFTDFLLRLDNGQDWFDSQQSHN